MTVYDVTPSTLYTLTGVADYPFTFRTLEETDIVVVNIGTDGTVTTLTLNVDYTVTLNEDGTGTITLLDTSLTGTLSVTRETPHTQEVAWVNNDPLDMITQENSFDKLTMIIQELEAAAVSYPPGFPATVEFPLPQSEAVIGWSEDGTTLVNYPSYGSFQALYDGAVNAAAAAAISAQNASDDADAAALSESNASDDATAAANSASAAANSASDASDAATAAEDAQALAEAAQLGAETAEGNAAVWAQDAANCAQAAFDSATAAADSASDASDSADAAAASAALINLPSATIPDESGYQIQAEDDGAGSPQWTLVPQTRQENAFCNPLMSVWQSGAGQFSANGTVVYTADGVKLGASGTGATADRIAGTTINGYTDTQYGLDFSFSTLGTLTGHYCRLEFPIEDVRKYHSTTLTVTFVANATAGAVFAVSAAQIFDSTDTDYQAIQASDFIIGTGSVEVYTVTLDIPSISGYTIGDNSYLVIRLWGSAGSAFDDQTNSLGLQDPASIYVYAMQIRPGVRDNIIEIPTPESIISQCHRYYLRFGGVAYQRFAEGSVRSAVNADFAMLLPTEMRINPVAGYSGVVQVVEGGTYFAITALSASGYDGKIVNLQATTSGLTLGSSVQLITNSATAWVELDARL